VARPTDQERGARLAFDIAREELQQLFPRELDRDFWAAIADEAAVTLAECGFLREALRHG
jgi:transcriptional regulator of acetoin/glycerol metabolism